MKAHTESFTKYEVARIVGARALQLAMDAPLLLKLSKEQLEAVQYDSLRIAELELEENVLPITVHRPLPPKRQTRLQEVREEKIEDTEIIAKEKEIEQEMSERAVEQGFVEEDDTDAIEEEPAGEEQ
jgi:DNA-directed RNA polymerase subunit K